MAACVEYICNNGTTTGVFNCWKWNGNTTELCMKQHCNMKI